MNSHWVNHAPYYRCRFPQEYALANKVQHPLNVSIREDRIVPRLDRWLAGLFGKDVFERTLDSLDAAQQASGLDDLRVALRRQIADGDSKLAQHRAALEAGADPVVVAGWMKEVQSARLEAELGLEKIAASPERRPSRDELAAVIRELGDMVQLLGDATPETEDEDLRCIEPEADVSLRREQGAG